MHYTSKIYINVIAGEQPFQYEELKEFRNMSSHLEFIILHMVDISIIRTVHSQHGYYTEQVWPGMVLARVRSLVNLLV